MSNLEECIETAINFARNLPAKWLSADYYTKQRLQFIDTEIEISAQFGSEVRKEIKKKFEIISCHSARHTYAILSLENGMRPEVLQRNLGHSKLSQTMEYVTILDNVRHFETLKGFSA